MDINEYQALAYVTANKFLNNIEQLTNAALGMSGESGEFADIVKKALFQGHELDTEHLTKELGDVCWYVALAATALSVDLECVMKKNIEKLKARYPEGFKSTDSINRKGDDI